MINKKWCFCVVLALGFSTTGWAAESSNQRQPAGSNQEHPPMGPPPQIAIDACVNKKEGDAVSFVSPRGDTIQAKCQTRHEGLVAVPEHPPQNGQQGNQQKNGPRSAGGKSAGSGTQ